MHSPDQESLLASTAIGAICPDLTIESVTPPSVQLPSGNGEDALLTRRELQAIAERLDFSPRQIEVLALLLTARSDKKIAEQLNVGCATVRTHLRRMFIRHKIKDRTELVITVFREFRKGCRQDLCPRNG
jgi:DNA-binding NarL/FixJ family response regulator